MLRNLQLRLKPQNLKDIMSKIQKIHKLDIFLNKKSKLKS